MNREENLYQIIFKTILNNINNQQSYNINNNRDEDDEFDQFNEKIIDFTKDNNIITLLQTIIISNKEIWSWNHFFKYLLNSNNNNSIFILKLNKELQIELLNLFLTFLRCINNENSPSDNIIIPIKSLNNFIIKSYIINNEGYSIYKKDYLFSFIIDSILSDIGLIIDTNNNNNSIGGFISHSNQEKDDELEDEDEEFIAFESIGLYYPFTVYYDKEFNRVLDEKMNKLNQDINEKEKKEKIYKDENKMMNNENQEDEDNDQVFNYSKGIRELIQTEFGSNKLHSIIGGTTGDNKESECNPHRYKALFKQKKVKSTVDTVTATTADNHLISTVSDLVIDDMAFNNDQQQQNDELHLQDWSVQFQSLIPEFNNMELDIESMFKNSMNYRPDPIIYNNESAPNNTQYQLQEKENEEGIKSSLKESTTAKKATPIPSNTSIKLENEEITPIIQIKEYIKNDNNISNENLKVLLEPLLLVSDIGEAIKLLGADTYSEDQFIHFMSTIVSLDFSFLSLSQFFSTLLLPKAIDVKNKSERDFLDLLTTCFKQHHTSFIGSFMVPLIVRNEEFLPPQKEIIIKLLQIKDIDNQVKVQFVSSLLASIQKTNHFIWNESVIWIFTTIIQLKLIFNDKIFSDLFEVLYLASKSLSKNQKFATLILTTISSYQKNIKEFVPRIEQLLLNMQINIKSSLNLLEKIKNS